MVFLLVLELFLLLAMLQGWRMMRRLSVSPSREAVGPANPWVLLALVAVVGLGELPFVLALLRAQEVASGHAVVLGRDFMPDAIFGLAGVLGVAVFAVLLRGQARARKVGFWAVGKNVLGVLGGLYLVFVVADHRLRRPLCSTGDLQVRQPIYTGALTAFINSIDKMGLLD